MICHAVDSTFLGTIKLNVDARVVVPQLIGLGVVFRNANDLVMTATTRRCAGNRSPEVLEAMAISYGLSFAVGFHFLDISVESDCMHVISLL